MRILDNKSNNKLSYVTAFLTRDEIVQLRSYLNQLLDNPSLHHVHLSSEDYQKEITVCLYDENNLRGFDARSIKLIKEDA